jgi:predicted amidophosphoribosyltransferase
VAFVPASRLHKGRAAAGPGRLPPRLALCRGCNEYIYDHERLCPHCGADVAACAARHAEDVARREALMNEVLRLVARSADAVTAGDS